MKFTRHNQCCIISGESGSGKTETTKYFMQQLLKIANSEDPDALGAVWKQQHSHPMQ